MTFQFQGLDHIQLAAPAYSEEKARAFFGNILGMNEIPKPDNLKKRGGVWFAVGTQQLHIGIQKDFSPALKAHPAFQVKNLDGLREQLIHNEIVVIDDEPLEGANRFYVQDPFGNRIEFLERV
ncbi:catechol 2,3-dioxygenase-like lactoylglutathione lyase family enzyme [Croceifilum oryzae]|uniref:Catechol 2,3-dioxygenase-like lactoylglutathione lyase family enzyme n=1 Tax=Croceifilum oryzae TaxID=1553429 RepID=A0AAJ1TIM7_9BACL|nr:VOC family protein [Croceifilum oryzae]MDQ0416689.1 catechol 2,3-dioxygenase-like lactoylglutathione lyase family enzyme [Croceifilum oryzae]